MGHTAKYIYSVVCDDASCVNGNPDDLATQFDNIAIAAEVLLNLNNEDKPCCESRNKLMRTEILYNWQDV